MRHTLGILVATTALLLTAGCGEDGPDTASDQPTETESSQPTQKPTQKPTHSSDVVAILSSSAAGGTTSKAAIDVGTSAGPAAWSPAFAVTRWRTRSEPRWPPPMSRRANAWSAQS